MPSQLRPEPRRPPAWRHQSEPASEAEGGVPPAPTRPRLGLAAAPEGSPSRLRCPSGDRG